MRKLFSFLLLTTLHVANGQSTEGTTILGNEDYLKKSKTQKTLGWITGATGLGVFTIGTIMYMSQYRNGLSGGTGYNEKTSNTGETLMYVGGGLVLVSVPFQKAYKRNKRMAASLSINNRPVVFPQLKDKAFAFDPSLCFRISLSKP